MEFEEAEAKIEEWNSKTQDGFGVWAIVPKRWRIPRYNFSTHN